MSIESEHRFTCDLCGLQNTSSRPFSSVAGSIIPCAAISSRREALSSSYSLPRRKPVGSGNAHAPSCGISVNSIVQGFATWRRRPSS